MGQFDFDEDEQDENWNPRRLALSLGLFDNPGEMEHDPQRFAATLGLTNSELAHQGKMPEQENYLDDNLGSVVNKLPIDQPNGSVVSGGREDLYHKYSQMLEQRPESESILQNFLARMPTHDKFRSSGLDKATAAVMGGVAALNSGPVAGIKTGQEYGERPFRRVQEDWKNEGQFVDDAMRLADSSRNRQAAGILNLIRQQEMERFHRGTEGYRKGQLRNQRQRYVDQASEAAAKSEETERYHREAEKDRDEARADRIQRGREQDALRRELKSLGGERLTPFQKVGLKRYEELTKPDEKLADTKLQRLVREKPELRELFEDTSEAKTMSERNQLIPRTDLSPYQKSVLDRLMKEANSDYRLIESLGFGQ